MSDKEYGEVATQRAGKGGEPTEVTPDDAAGQMTTDVTEQMRAYQEIKAAEAAAREKLLREAEVTIVTAEPDKTMEFDVWWMDINRRVTLKAWMKEVIKADFKGRGLTGKEDPQKYDEALRLFGVKF